MADASPAARPAEGWWTKPGVAVKNADTGAQVRRGPGRYTVMTFQRRRPGQRLNLVSVREPGQRGFSRPRRHAPDNARTRLEMGLGSDTLVSWYDPESDSVGVTTRTPREDWTEPVELADSVGVPKTPWASVAPDAGMLVVWPAANDDGSVRMEAALRTPDGEWGDAFTVVEDWEYYNFVDVVVGSGMNGAVIWKAACDIFNPDLIFPSEVVILDQGTFGPVETIENSECPHTFFSLAIDDAGRTVAAVNGYDFKFLVKAAIREPGESFGPAVKLNPDGERAFYANVAASPDGETLVVWARQGRKGARAALGDADRLGKGRVIAGGVSSPETYGRRGLVMNAAGDAAVLVHRYEPRQGLAAAYRDGARAGFRRPELVADRLTAYSLFSGAIAMGKGGRPTVVWRAKQRKSAKRFDLMISERRAKRR